jgi:hypothetical protein
MTLFDIATAFPALDTIDAELRRKFKELSNVVISTGEMSEICADEFEVSRKEMDDYAFEST